MVKWCRCCLRSFFLCTIQFIFVSVFFTFIEYFFGFMCTTLYVLVALRFSPVILVYILKYHSVRRSVWSQRRRRKKNTHRMRGMKQQNQQKLFVTLFNFFHVLLLFFMFFFDMCSYYYFIFFSLHVCVFFFIVLLMGSNKMPKAAIRLARCTNKTHTHTHSNSHTRKYSLNKNIEPAETKARPYHIFALWRFFSLLLSLSLSMNKDCLYKSFFFYSLDEYGAVYMLNYILCAQYALLVGPLASIACIHGMAFSIYWTCIHLPTL